MSIFLKFVVYISSLAIVMLSIIYGRDITFEEQLPIYDGLRTTSAIVFAIMGAWIALIYPGKLSQLLSPGGHEIKDIEHTRKLFKPMIYSTAILIIVIGIAFLVPLAKQISLLGPYKKIFRSISFGMLAVLTLMQIWSIILTLIPGDKIQDELTEEQLRRRIIGRMRPKDRK